MSQADNLEMFKDGVESFMSSPQEAVDILEFSIVCAKAYSPGNGIGVPQAKKIIDNLFAEREK